jgi:hypothetical protein
MKRKGILSSLYKNPTTKNTGIELEIKASSPVLHRIKIKATISIQTSRFIKH